MDNKTKIVLAVVSIFLVAFVVWVAWGNTALELNEYTISNDKIPEEFSGYRIAQVSDLHNAQMGEHNKELLQLLQDAKPDIIVVTGDILDVHKTDFEVALNFAEEAAKIAPCYYVTGNNEAYIEDYPLFKEHLLETGFTILDDAAISIRHHGASISLIGVNDPAFHPNYAHSFDEDIMQQALDSIVYDNNSFLLLLSHRPELLSVYAACDIDLVLSGHVHGGQFRIPFIGGVYGPDQGFLPEFDAGLYKEGNTQMIVSRGIGNSRFPFRLNNRPEIILIELQSA